MAGEKSIFYIINVDTFFLSHRLPLALAARNQGYNIFILTRDTGERQRIEADGLHFIPIDFDRSGTNPFKDILIIFHIFRLIRKYKPVLLHNVTIKPAIYGSIAARYANRGTKVINAISGLGYNFIGGRDGLVQKILRRLISFAFKSGVNFIFQNEDDCRLYKSLGLLAHNGYRIIKGSGVDGTVFTYQPPVEKKMLEVVITSRLLYDKGIVEFMNAALLLKDKWTGKAKFIIAGDIDQGNKASISGGDLKKYLVDDYLIWIGFQKHVKPLLIESDIVCLPSYREGLPKSLIEAMAIGRPIVTTDVPGCRECVNEGENGFLVPARNTEGLAAAIDKLLYDQQLRLRMGEASRKKMEMELSLQQVVGETMKFYDELVVD